MMQQTYLALRDSLWATIQAHLLPKESGVEEAVFIFAKVDESPDRVTFEAIEIYPVPSEGFEERSRFYLELTDETKAGVIKRAHDLNAALVEVHSHPTQVTAEFSASDMYGFCEFVPHVRWRLKGRPYAAIVVGDRTFDALAWTGTPGEPSPLTAILVNNTQLRPTHATGPTLETSLEYRRSIQSK